MNDTVRALQPTEIWNHFADLNAIPRPSKKEEKAVAFIRAFGESLNLPTTVDETGNVIIRKPASPGMEGRATVILQSHLDMVHQKNSDSAFDFNTQGIEMVVDGDWVKARGTTLGADNGIGVASIMTILASKDIAHPSIEALFTVDEETGMTGALALKSGALTGRIMLNLDTEEDDELTIGCAGGVDVTATGHYEMVAHTGQAAYLLSLKGLTGGHSGVDIHKGRANANKLMNRLLTELSDLPGFAIASIDGGSLRNAIPRESRAQIMVDHSAEVELKNRVEAIRLILKNEYHFTDPALSVNLENDGSPAAVMSPEFQYRFLRSMYSCPNGIYRMSPGIAGLVQSSNNIARVIARDRQFTIQCLTRSSVDSEKADLARSIASSFELCGASIGLSGAYPGWEPRPDYPIVTLMSDLYAELFKSPAKVNAIHAGLECGILGGHYPGMQVISFGPNIHGAHSPDEKVQISSVQKFWGFLLEILKRFPSA